jgi:hypothetical protein
MPELQNLPVGVGTTSLAVQNASVSDELARAGIGLGDLVQNTGQAVAATQNKLNATSAETATALATTLVDVIAVQESVYDDQGNLAEAKSHMMKLPLINFIDPVFYEWSQVRLQGQFTAREFADAASSKSFRYQSSDKLGQAGLLVFLGGGYNQLKFQHDSTEMTSESTSDISYGNIRMMAELKPRRDVSVPKPRQIMQGPRLAILQGEITDVLDGALLKARTMSLLIEYRRRTGEPIAGKAISIETEGVAWSFADGSVTDADGRVEITLRREFLEEGVDTSPQDFVVSARIGIVQNNMSVNF